MGHRQMEGTEAGSEDRVRRKRRRERIESDMVLTGTGS